MPPDSGFCDMKPTAQFKKVLLIAVVLASFLLPEVSTASSEPPKFSANAAFLKGGKAQTDELQCHQYRAETGF